MTMAAPLTSIDLFSGAWAGWTVGFGWAGIRTVAAAEACSWRRRQYARRFPEVRLYHDVRAVDAGLLARDGIAQPDIVCGSPPCKDASVANTKGRGVDGAETGKFFDYIRTVGSLRPRWCVAENNPGLGNRGLHRVEAALAAEGYTVWVVDLGANDVGAPHRRRRLFIIGVRSDVAAALADAHGVAGDAGQGLAAQRPEKRREPQARAGADADPDRVGELEPEGAFREVGGRACHASSDDDAAHAAGVERQVGSGEKLSPGTRAVSTLAGDFASCWSHWVEGPPALDDVDDGLSKGDRRHWIAAVGDGVLPQLTSAVGRTIIRAEALIDGRV